MLRPTPPPPYTFWPVPYYAKVESVGSCGFQTHLFILACVMSREFTLEAVTKFLPAQFLWIWCKCNLIGPFKDFQSDQIQRSSCEIFTAHYACKNADLNLTLVLGTTKGFSFQIINSLIEPWEGGYAWPALTVRWCYTRRFATTIFSATQCCNIVSNSYNIVPTLQHCVELKIFVANR